MQDLISQKLNLLSSENDKDIKATDVTLPGKNISLGSRHPIAITINDIMDILGSYGFTSVEGLEIEDEFHNFEALNISDNHPDISAPSKQALEIILDIREIDLIASSFPGMI